MSPPFHGDRMRAYGAIIRDRTLAEVRTWQPGARSSLVPAMRRITIDVILQAVLGIDGEARRERFRAAIVENLDAYTPPLLVLPALRRPLGGLGPWARFARARDRVCALFLEEIRERRRRGGEGREDMLSLLMEARYEDGTALDDGELVDELRTLIVGGHETTTTALVWSLFHLHRLAPGTTGTPPALATLRDELATLAEPVATEALGQLPYLGAVCNEALRLHPVVPIVPRRAVAPVLPAGAPRAARAERRGRDDPAPHEPGRLPRSRALPAGALPLAQIHPLRVRALRRRRAALHRRGVRRLPDADRARDHPRLGAPRPAPGARAAAGALEHHHGPARPREAPRPVETFNLIRRFAPTREYYAPHKGN